MRVIATKDGFFKSSRVRAGQVFEVPEGTKGKWFVAAPAAPAAPAEAGKAKTKKGKAEGPSTFSEIAKQDGAAQIPKGSDDLV